MDSLQPTKYKLQSQVTGSIYEDSGWMLDAPGEACPGLLRAVYDQKQFELKEDRFGLYKYASWLPVNRFLEGSSAPVTYRSSGLASLTGLSRLYITFSGYWPERNARMKTCSFKETEAYSVCARMRPEQKEVLVVASAGNTARSFARVCSDNNIPLLLCVPMDTIEALWFDVPLKDCVKLIATPSGSDYFDAIHLSNQICRIDGFIAEGGAKNVARRDGMGTTVLSAVSFLSAIPDCYFQAIGSGTGAIAAWEANLRLISDGRFGDRKMKLFLSQNYPFHPIVDAWKLHSRELSHNEDHIDRELALQIYAKVLSNRRPPYSLTGGLYDALCDTDGEVVHCTNEEAIHASALFQESEGIDIHPAAAIATASLLKAVKEGKINENELIMLNITGGGEERFKQEYELFFMKPSLVVDAYLPFEKISQQIREVTFGIG